MKDEGALCGVAAMLIIWINNRVAISTFIDVKRHCSVVFTRLLVCAQNSDYKGDSQIWSLEFAFMTDMR